MRFGIYVYILYIYIYKHILHVYIYTYITYIHIYNIYNIYIYIYTYIYIYIYIIYTNVFAAILHFSFKWMLWSENKWSLRKIDKNTRFFPVSLIPHIGWIQRSPLYYNILLTNWSTGHVYMKLSFLKYFTQPEESSNSCFTSQPWSPSKHFRYYFKSLLFKFFLLMLLAVV